MWQFRADLLNLFATPCHRIEVTKCEDSFLSLFLLAAEKWFFGQIKMSKDKYLGSGNCTKENPKRMLVFYSCLDWLKNDV